MELAIKNLDVGAIKKAHDIFMTGDISKLNPKEQVDYVKGLCSSLGLNPLTNPIEFLRLNNKLTPYVKKDGTDQLRKLYDVSITKLEEKELNGVFIVKAYAQLPSGRTDSSTGAVTIRGLQGDKLCNALMKAETKAKRRATLSICGLGFLDESEVETIPDAKRVVTFENLPDSFRDLVNIISRNNMLNHFYEKENIDPKSFSNLDKNSIDDLIKKAKTFILENELDLSESYAISPNGKPF